MAVIRYLSPPSQEDSYYFDTITMASDIYGELYNKLLLIGDFNAEEKEPCMGGFLYLHNFKNLVKHKTCFKSIENPSCVSSFFSQTASTVFRVQAQYHAVYLIFTRW